MAAVRSTLEAVPGVVGVEVDFPNKTASVVVDEAVPAADLAGSLTGRYSASVKQ